MSVADLSRRRKVFGIGINDVDLPVEEKVLQPDGTIKRVENPYYRRWKSMLKRCYTNTQREYYNTYDTCTVCDEWIYLSNFKAWMEQQDWEGKDLDKDLLVYQNKVYSPDTCLFVDKRVNTFTTKCNRTRGEYPLGVTQENKRKSSINVKMFRAQIQKGTSKTEYLGVYATPIEAHRVWQLAKIEIAKSIRNVEQDPIVRGGLQRIIDKIQYDYDNGLETIDF